MAPQAATTPLPHSRPATQRLCVVRHSRGWLSWPAEIGGPEELRPRATEAEILGVTVAVCSLDDLKAMKRVAARTRDLADLEDLEVASD